VNDRPRGDEPVRGEGHRPDEPAPGPHEPAPGPHEPAPGPHEPAPGPHDVRFPPAPPAPHHVPVFGEEARGQAAVAEALDETTTSRAEARVAILIVVATLAAAMVGYLQVWSSGRSDAAATEAQRSAIAATARQSRTDQWSDVQTALASRASLARSAADQPSLQASVFGNAVPLEDRLAARRSRALADRFGDLAAVVGSGFTGVPLRGPLTEADDPAFPTRFVAETSREPIRLRAMQDSQNDEASGWSSRAATYTAVLTLFAVALYLLGISMALPRNVGRWFERGGIAFTVVGLVWAGLGSANRPEPASQLAASEFAAGTVALTGAFDAYDSSAYNLARDHLTKAIEAQPDFARAYLNRAQAVYFGSSPNPGLGSVTSPQALRASIEDLRTAVDLGLDNALALGNIGALSFQEAMDQDSPELLDQALDFTRQVLEIDPGRPLWLYNLAVTELAAGQQDAAAEAFARADRAALRQPSTAAFWATGALSALDVLASHRPETTTRVRAMKDLVVGEVFGTGRTTAPSGLALDLVVSPSLVQFAIPVAQAGSIDPAKDTVVAEWYYDDPFDHGFAVLPEVSGQVALQRADDGGWFGLVEYLPNAQPPRCLPTGSYRVEVYVNGHLAGTGTADGSFGDLQTVTDPVLNAGFCVPADWTPSSSATPGVTQAWASKDESQGLVVIRADLGDAGAKASTEAILDGAVRGFARKALTGLGKPGPAQHFFFMGLDDHVELAYPYRGGIVEAGAGVDPGEGAVIVALAFGPKAQNPVIDQAFRSLSSLQPVVR
jgi:Tfp pilus assembly protein PilF